MGLLPGLLVIACYLSFTPSSLKYSRLKNVKCAQIEYADLWTVYRKSRALGGSS